MYDCAVALQTGQKAKGKRQKAKGKRQKAKGKRQKGNGIVKTCASFTGLHLNNDTYAFRMPKTANTALKKKTADKREEGGWQEGTKADSEQKEATSMTVGELELQQKEQKQRTRLTATESRKA